MYPIQTRKMPVSYDAATWHNYAVYGDLEKPPMSDPTIAPP